MSLAGAGARTKTDLVKGPPEFVSEGQGIASCVLIVGKQCRRAEKSTSGKEETDRAPRRNPPESPCGPQDKGKGHAERSEWAGQDKQADGECPREGTQYGRALEGDSEGKDKEERQGQTHRVRHEGRCLEQKEGGHHEKCPRKETSGLIVDPMCECDDEHNGERRGECVHERWVTHEHTKSKHKRIAGWIFTEPHSIADEHERNPESFRQGWRGSDQVATSECCGLEKKATSSSVCGRPSKTTRLRVSVTARAVPERRNTTGERVPLSIPIRRIAITPPTRGHTGAF